MHLLALIPFATLLLSAAFAAVAFAWNSERRATGAMIQVFLCIGGWALIDLLSQIENDPDRVVLWLAWMHVPVLLLGTFVLKLVTNLVPASAESARPFIRWGAWFSLGFASLAPILPGVVDGAHRNVWGGWTPDYGVVSIALVPLACVMPGIAIIFAMRARSRRECSGDRHRSVLVSAGIFLSALTALATDIVLPFAGIPFPRLGACTAVIAAITVWLNILHQNEDLSLTPQGIARAVLADLHEGVAFVGRDGTILSVNGRLAELSGRRAADLVGAMLSDLVDAPFDLVRSGLRDREFRMRSKSGDLSPVSLSSSSECDTSGRIDWIIVVFRDLRGVDALRRRLLTSGRLAAIGELAAGIAHEVNNPAAFIRSDLNFLRGRLSEIHRDLEKEEGFQETAIFREGYGRIDRAMEGVERIVEVVGDVRGFAHLGGQAGAESQPEAIIEGAIRLARLERREEVGLHLARSHDIGRVNAGQDLKQVLLALIRMMTISSRVGGSVEIGLRVESSDLCISLIADDLAQRAESQIHRFEMAREDVLEASTTDLGLAIAIELIDQLGGSLHVAARSEFALSIDLVWPLAEDPVE